MIRRSKCYLIGVLCIIMTMLVIGVGGNGVVVYADTGSGEGVSAKGLFRIGAKAVPPLNQDIQKGDIDTSFTSDGTGTRIGTNLSGEWYLSNSYSISDQVFNVVSGKKYAAYCKLKSSSVGRIAGLALQYSDSTIQQNITTQELEQFAVFTAIATDSVNFKVVEGISGLMERDYQVFIPMDGEYANYTDAQMLEIARNGYWEGTKTCVENYDLVSRDKNFYDIHDAQLENGKIIINTGQNAVASPDVSFTFNEDNTLTITSPDGYKGIRDDKYYLFPQDITTIYMNDSVDIATMLTFYDSSKQFIGAIYNVSNGQVPNGAYYYRIAWEVRAAGTFQSTPIYLSSVTMPTYEPYTSDKTEFSVPEHYPLTGVSGDIKNYINENGDYRVEVNEWLIDGTEQWEVWRSVPDTGVTAFALFRIRGASFPIKNNNFICDRFSNVYNSMYYGDIGVGYSVPNAGTGETFGLGIKNSVIGIQESDSKEVKEDKVEEWLSNNNITITYQLENPLTVEDQQQGYKAPSPIQAYQNGDIIQYATSIKQTNLTNSNTIILDDKCIDIVELTSNGQALSGTLGSDGRTITLDANHTGLVYAKGKRDPSTYLNVKLELIPIPDNVKAIPDDKKVNLSWDAVAGADSYTIKRKTSPDNDYTTIASNITTTTYEDSGLDNGTTYNYVVVANKDGKSGSSDEVSATPSGAPPIPTNLQTSSVYEKITLTWNNVEGATGYTVKRSEELGGPFTEIGTNITQTSFIDTSVVSGKDYYYVVAAYNDDGQSGNSNSTKGVSDWIKHLIIEVKDHYNGDRTHMNEIEVFDVDGQKISYTIDQVFDSARNGKPNYWYDTSYGGAKLYDGLYNTSSHLNHWSSSGSGTWTRMLLTLPDNDGVAKVNLWTSNTYKPQKINIYEANNYDYNMNLRDRSNANLNIFGEAFIKNTPHIEKYAVTRSYMNAPLNLEAKGGNEQVDLSWEAVDGATGYHVKRSLSENGPYISIANNIPTTSYQDISARNGLTYYYVVTAENEKGESSNSSEVKVRVSATRYLIVEVLDHYSGGSSYINELEIYDIEGREVAFTAIEVFDSAMNGIPYEWNNYASDDKKNKGKLNDGDYGTSAAVNWGSISGDGTWTRIVLDLEDNSGISKVNAWTSTLCKPHKVNIYEATSYDYNTHVKNRDNGNMTLFGEAFIKNNNLAEKYTINKSFMSAPSNLVATGGNAQVHLQWNPIAGATGYSVKRSKTENGPYSVVANNVPNNTYTDETTMNGLIYYYVVSAINNEGESSYSNEVKVKVTAARYLIIEVDDHYNKDCTQIKELEVFDNDGRKISYTLTDIYDSAVNGEPTYWSHSSYGKTMLFDNNYASGTLINYTSNPGSGTWARIVLDLEDNNGISKVNVWTAVAYKPQKINIYGATSYDYTTHVKNRDNSNLTIFGEAFIKNNNLAEKYTINKSYMNAPSNLVATGGNAQVKLQWDQVQGATGYTIKRSKTENGPYTVVANNVPINTYTDETAKNGLIYYYVVSAMNDEGESSYSNEAKVRVTTARYLIIEIDDHHTEDYAQINEIEVYDNDGRKINYTPTDAFDSARNDVPTYWENSSYGKTRLYDNNYSSGSWMHYTSNPGSGTWARMVLDLEDNNGISKVDIWTASSSKPKKVSIYKTLDYEYLVNIRDRVNDGMTYLGSVEIDSSLLAEKYTVLPQLPYAPTDINYTVDDKEVSLVWNSVTNALTYNVKRSTVAGGPYVTIGEHIKQTGFTDNSVTNNVQYYYVITAVNAAGESEVSEEILIIPQVVVPSSPLNVQGIPADQKVDLSWNLVHNADTYVVKRGEVSGGPYEVIAEGITATSYSDVSVTNGTTYYYVIVAKNEAGESGHSIQYTVRAGAMVLNPPTNLTAIPGDQKATLSWNSTNHATGYKVKRAVHANGPYADIAGNIINNGFVDTNLINNTTYYYVVVAINDAEQSGDSVEVSVTPGIFTPEQVINFVGIAGDNQVTLSWDVNEYADSYTIKRSMTPEGQYTTIASGLIGTSYIDQEVANNTSYYYKVIGVNKAGESPDSVMILVIPKAKEGKRVILALTMTNGMQKDYDISQTQLVDFLNWYRSAVKNEGMPYFTIIDGEDKGPYNSKRDYIIYQKILYFEINEYTK